MHRWINCEGTIAIQCIYRHIFTIVILHNAFGELFIKGLLGVVFLKTFLIYCVWSFPKCILLPTYSSSVLQQMLNRKHPHSAQLCFKRNVGRKCFLCLCSVSAERCAVLMYLCLFFLPPAFYATGSCPLENLIALYGSCVFEQHLMTSNPDYLFFFLPLFHQSIEDV